MKEKDLQPGNIIAAISQCQRPIPNKADPTTHHYEMWWRFEKPFWMVISAKPTYRHKRNQQRQKPLSWNVLVTALGSGKVKTISISTRSSFVFDRTWVRLNIHSNVEYGEWYGRVTRPTY